MPITAIHLVFLMFCIVSPFIREKENPVFKKQGKVLYRFHFFHPDYTVGTRIARVQPLAQLADFYCR